ncbi:MAG: hypothetical protein LLG16_03875 [Euryarchaeota archaeon]|nr:hypothetical protein [Euryarchaeota archaeon]
MSKRGRPRGPPNGYKTSIHIDAASQQILERYGLDANVSKLFNDCVHSFDKDSPIVLANKIEEFNKQLAETERNLSIIRIQRDEAQSRLNMLQQGRDTIEQQRVVLMKSWMEHRKDKLKGQFNFTGWLLAPQNISLIRDCGFENVEELIAWCKGQTVNGGQT